MKKFNTLLELNNWVDEQKYDRYSPYDIWFIDVPNITVHYIRVD